MIWFCSWFLAMVLMSLLTAFYLWFLKHDPGMLPREIDRLTPRDWVWRPSALTVPAIDVILYVFCAVGVAMRRRALRTKPAAEDQAASRLTYVAQWLFANPAGFRLTLPFIPMVGIALLFSAPLLFEPNGISSFAWGFALLFWITLVATGLFPDAPDVAGLNLQFANPSRFVRSRGALRSGWLSRFRRGFTRR